MSDTKPKPESRLCGRRLLVVEDDGEVLEFTAKVLERAGASVSRSRTAAEGIKSLGRESFDAAVIDWNLGTCSADALLAAVRGREGGLANRTVVMTGDFLNQGDERNVSRYGFRVLCKPFRPSTLVNTLEELLG